MLSQCKEEVLSSVQSAYGGDFQERSEKKKKKSRNSTFQKYHSHAGRKSRTLFLIVNLCRLKEPRGPIPVVGVGDGCNSPAQLLARWLGLGGERLGGSAHFLTRYSMTYSGCLLLWIPAPQKGHCYGLYLINSALAWRRIFSSPPQPKSRSLSGWWKGRDDCESQGSFHQNPSSTPLPCPLMLPSLYRLCIQATS